MEREQPSLSGTLVAAVCFMLMATTGVVLLITTLVMWVATMLDSLIWATLIVGGGALLTAAAIYFATLHRPLKRIQQRIETVYDVAQSLRDGWRWVVSKIEWVILLWQVLNDNDRCEERKSGTK